MGILVNNSARSEHSGSDHNKSNRSRISDRSSEKKMSTNRSVPPSKKQSSPRKEKISGNVDSSKVNKSGVVVKSGQHKSVKNEKRKSLRGPPVRKKSYSKREGTSSWNGDYPKGSSQGAASLKNRIRSARKRGLHGDVHDLRYLVEEGPLSFRSFGFFGGFFMIFAAALDFIEDQMNGDFSPVEKIVTFYLWFCGLLTTQLEGRPFHLQINAVYYVVCYLFNFLRFVWGRGFFYFFTGCIQFFLFSKYNMICGVYFMILGVFSIVFGYRASVKLASLRNSISSRSDIKFLFHSFDKDRDGLLNHEEFREMLMSLGQNLDYNDFVAALSAIDEGNNQYVTYEDLENWWESFHVKDLPPGSDMYRNISMQRSKSRSAGLV